MKTASTKIILPLGIALLGLGTGSVMAGNISQQLLQEYATAGQAFSASTGKAAWTTEHQDAKSGKLRSCSTCHTSNLKQSGKHARTGKTIEPMAPSVNAERLTDRKHVEKWFKRNCKWVLGRECTAQEKGDYITYLQSL